MLKIFNIQNPAEPVLVHAIDKIADLIVRDNTLFAVTMRNCHKMNPSNIKRHTTE
jgi:hypothetical protein